MKLFNIINEKLGDYVYIKQSIKMLSIMLRTNKIVLDEYPVSDKTFYVLHTSPKRKDIIKNGETALSVIQLNGEKLNAHIKHKNVDHYLNSKNRGNIDDLFSDEKIIPNAANFIEQVSILIEDADIVPVTELKEIESMCKEMNIPLFFYKNSTDFDNNRRQNKVVLGNPDYNYKRQNFSKIPEIIKALLYFGRHNELHKVPEKYARYLNEIVIDQKRANFIKKIKTDIHKLGENPLAKELITNLYKKYQTDTIETIVKKISDNWKTIINKVRKNKSK